MARDGRDVFKYGTVLLLMSFGVSGFQWLFTLFASRGLGVTQYGAYLTALSVFIIMVFPLTAFQMAVADRAARYQVRGKKKAIAALFRKTLVFSSLFGLSLAAVLFLAGKWLMSAWKLDSASIVALGLLLVTGVLVTSLRGFLQGLQRFVAFGLNPLLDAFIKFSMCVVLIYMLNLGPAYALGTTVVSMAIASAIAVWLLRSYLSGPAEIINRKI